ncbi:MAG: TonB-dependent receptor [Bacteroidota bacterium]|nr:TonB-dependent receptor [Bacteroidota bacterium]MDX5505006.1 TonB-dependent receptor [Bacteroidota bacterium]
MRKHFLLSVTLLFFGMMALGQEAQIRGVVMGSGGNPLEGVLILHRGQTAISNEDGSYQITVPADRSTLIIFSRLGYFPDTLNVSPKPQQIIIHNPVLRERENILGPVEVTDKQDRLDNSVRIDPKSIEFRTGPSGGIEGIIKTLTGVVSNNEMSSQYSVRGGSFDENLVYVNGIEVYRPFLVRAGQQEGLSFVNPDMVDNITFSAGGFNATYGDKMASVLDIAYRDPTEFGLQFTGSLMGTSLTLEGITPNKKWTAIGSFRYRTNQLLLGGLDTDADFRPRFYDGQILLTHHLNDKWDISFLGNLATNLYQVVPSSRTTRFGTFQEALQLNVFFEGQEQYSYNTKFGALTASFRPNNLLHLQFIASGYQTVEQEYFDVIGAYRLGELNTSLGSDDFGEVTLIRGVGGYQNYARNRLDAIIGSFAHRGVWADDEQSVEWGIKFEYDDIVDRYKEWERIDSAGYSVTHSPSTIDSIINDRVYFTPTNGLEIWNSYDTRASIVSTRLMTYLNYSRKWDLKQGLLRAEAGVRTHFWSFNGQTTVSPRMGLFFQPDWEENWVFRLSGGFYHQPPFYREMRSLEGEVNENIRAQVSIHYIAGADHVFTMWNRPFKLVSEIYYKDFYDLIPYELENVRIRYSARNEAIGRTYGADFRINGEFVKGAESWASLSVFRVEEDIEGDGVGYIPRPTDNRFSLSLFFQDYLPKDPTFRVTLGLTYVGGFPFGPPKSEPKDRTYRSKPYRRVDIGFIKVLKEEGKTSKIKFLNGFKSMWVGLEVFNLLETQNPVSYLWIRDASAANQYAVPNYLTSRLLNVKLRFTL